MKLSQAIFKGCELTEKCKRSIYRSDKNGKFSCALGAAAVGANLIDLEKDFFSINGSTYTAKEGNFDILNVYINEFPNRLIPDIIKNKKEYKVTKKYLYINTIIFKLNDTYNWSREAIALWVETLEDYLENKESNQESAKAEKDLQTVGI